MDAALRALFTAPPSDDRALRDALEALARRPRFAEFTWFWGPELASRDRVSFRPFILSNFSSFALNAKGEFFEAWRGASAASLERWLAAVDAADDIELTRRLYTWRLERIPWKERPNAWHKDLLRRFASAADGAARFTALAKIDTGMALDAPTAAALYDVDRAAARRFILTHLPWLSQRGDARESWAKLLEMSRDRDPDFHFDLYRRIVGEDRWRRDVLELGRQRLEPAALDAELERRHPRWPFPCTAEVFYELVRARRRDVVPYVVRHAGSVSPRWGFLGKREAKGLPELLRLASDEGWLDLWAALLRSGASDELFDAEVRGLVRSKTLDANEIQTRLLLIAGHGREAHFPGVSFARVHPLEEDTALELYRRFPALVRGPYRMHVAPGWRQAYPRLARAAIEAGDTELVDYLAARAGIQMVGAGNTRGWKEALERLTTHYEALPEEEFVIRASSALSRMPAFAVWDYDALLKGNRLARLLFERSTTLYLSNAKAVRDLLESPQIHVQVLAFRILGQDDDRARALAAQNADLLQATLFRPLRRRTRLLAFKAIENAAKHDPGTAQYLLGRMRDALALPEKRYPTEQLIGLIGRVLYRWPELRGPRETPRVYGMDA